MFFLDKFKNFILFTLIFYILVILETTYFDFSKIILVIIFLLIILINIFDFTKEEKLFSSLILGFYLDVFSLTGFFGYYTLTMLLFYFLINFIFEKYVRISFFQKR